MEKLKAKRTGIDAVKELLGEISLDPEETNSFLESVQSAPLVNKQKSAQILLRPQVGLLAMTENILKLGSALSGYSKEILEQAEIQTKYDTYIEKEKELVKKMSQLEDLLIPDNFNYDKLVSLSNEARHKFTKIKPRTLGQASRISGVNPSDVQILMVFMGR